MARLSTDRRDLKLSGSPWSLTFENRDLAFSTGSAAVGQAVKFRLQLLRGEWFLDKDAGTPWFQSILGTKFNMEAMRSIFFERASTVDGVTQVTAMAVTFNNVTRAMRVTYEILTVFGDTIQDTIQLGVAA